MDQFTQSELWMRSANDFRWEFRSVRANKSNNIDDWFICMYCSVCFLNLVVQIRLKWWGRRPLSVLFLKMLLLVLSVRCYFFLDNFNIFYMRVFISIWYSICEYNGCERLKLQQHFVNVFHWEKKMWFCCCSVVDLFLTILFLSPWFILDISVFVYRCVCVIIGCFTCRNVKFQISINNCLLNKLFYWMISHRFDVVWLKGFISFTALYSILRKIKKREREKKRRIKWLHY